MKELKRIHRMSRDDGGGDGRLVRVRALLADSQL